mgnify:CR=1 FL=1
MTFFCIKAGVGLEPLPFKPRKGSLGRLGLLKIKQKEQFKKGFKIYDFKNDGWRTKYGREKGKFECFLDEYKIDTLQIKNAESSTICIDRFNVY